MTRGPRVLKNGDGSERVVLGSVVSTVLAAAIVSGAGALVTVGVLAYRADAEERKVEKIDQAVSRQGRNQMRIDEQQRRIRQDSEWANAKLDALLEALDVSERVPRPELPPSSLEKPGERGSD